MPIEKLGVLIPLIVIINSDFLNGLNVKEAKEKISKFLIEKKQAKTKIIYRLKDWSISRQRYWGCQFL